MTRSSTPPATSDLRAGAAAREVTPRSAAFLYGYPHVQRMSTGTHDPLLASALVLQQGPESVMFISVDVIFVAKKLAARVRHEISRQTGIAPGHILISATHTHSGPATVRMVSNMHDTVVPPPSEEYLEELAGGIVAAGVAAWKNRVPAEIAQMTAECPGLGGNRHDPAGPTIDGIPILAARSRTDSSRMLGMMYVNRVHPTVLHEDSTLISGDFPGLCRQRLQSDLLGDDCPVLCHLGATGNQSPRHVVHANTMGEARRLGDSLASSLTAAMADAHYSSAIFLDCQRAEVELPLREFPGTDEAARQLELARRHFAKLQASQAPKSQIRTAECALFGSEEELCLARVAETGDLATAAVTCMPAEIQVMTIGEVIWIAWPGEVFAEYALRILQKYPRCAIVTLANGELQGYLVTEQVVKARAYEAANALFASPQSGELLVERTLALLAAGGHRRESAGQ